MKYCTFKENGKSFIYEDGYIYSPYNGEYIYMGDKLFNVTFPEFMRSQIVIRDF